MDIRDGTHDDKDGRGLRCVDDADLGSQPEILNGVSRAVPGDREDGDASLGSELFEPAGQAHSRARSRHAYRIPRSRMPMNMPISTMAIAPSRTKTTAQGYMKTISMSKARKIRAIG